jgi:serine-type D-Ala-D-Ala carboxypeptidase (penicillin-binding protein 5/6)
MPRLRRPRRYALAASCLALAMFGSVAWTGPALATGISPSAAHRPASQPGYIAAYEAELANGTTGKLMWGRRQYSQFPIASITKVMTALVVIRSGDLGRRIKITEADERYLGCCIQGAGLIPGDILTARQLLYAMLIPSGADAARALAVSYGPGISNFVAKMNSTARELKLVGTHFTSFDGVLPSNVSTPRNVLLLGEAAMKYAVFRDVVRLPSYHLPAARHHHGYTWQNTNLLLGHYRGLIGIKTGWIPAAGECLLFEAVRGSKILIGVVLDSAPTKTGQSFADAATMLNWGFRQLSTG